MRDGICRFRIGPENLFPAMSEERCMKKTMKIAAVCAVLVAGVLIAAIVMQGTSSDRVFKQASPSIVVVLGLDKKDEVQGQGSGVVVGTQEVITNCHPVGQAAEIAVLQVSQQKKMKASVLARNDERDLCLLFVDELSAASMVPLEPAKDLSVGDEVYVVGAPAGLEVSLVRGIVWELRSFGKERVPLLQTDMAISAGSSGGGVFNGAGEFVGITTFKWRGENLNFVLPTEWVWELRDQGRLVLAAERHSTCIKKPDFDCVIGLARSVANDIDTSFRIYALRDIVATQTEAGDITSALETAQSITDAYWRADTLVEIVAVQAKAGNIQAAKQTLAEALETAQSITDAKRRAGPLMKIAPAQAKVRDITSALETAQSIPDVGHAFALRGIATVQVEAGDIASALETAQSITDAWKRAEALVEVATAQAKAEDRYGASSTFATALKTVQRIANSLERVRGLSDIATAQAETGDGQAARQTLTAALGIAQSVTYAGSRANALKYIAVAQAEAGDAQAARQTFTAALKTAQSATDATDADFRVKVLRDIATAQAQAGHRQAARQTLTAALKIGQSITHAPSRELVLDDLATAQVKLGDIPSALKTMQGITDAGSRLGILRRIATAQVETGDGQAARHTLTAALETAQSITHALSRGLALSGIATAYVKAGDIPSALKIAQGITVADYRAAPLKDIAIAQAEAGNFKSAMKTAMNIEAMKVQVNALASIAKLLKSN